MKKAISQQEILEKGMAVGFLKRRNQRGYYYVKNIIMCKENA